MTELLSEELTPADRAIRIGDFAADYTDYDARTGIIDLLADIRHWCDANDETFANLDRIAHEHYLAEIHADGRFA